MARPSAADTGQESDSAGSLSEAGRTGAVAVIRLPDSLTPDWHGEQLEPDLIIAASIHTRAAELGGQQPTEPGNDRWAGLPDSWAVAAAGA